MNRYILNNSCCFYILEDCVLFAENEYATRLRKYVDGDSICDYDIIG